MFAQVVRLDRVGQARIEVLHLREDRLRLLALRADRGVGGRRAAREDERRDRGHGEGEARLPAACPDASRRSSDACRTARRWWGHRPQVREPSSDRRRMHWEAPRKALQTRRFALVWYGPRPYARACEIPRAVRARPSSSARRTGPRRRRVCARREARRLCGPRSARRCSSCTPWSRRSACARAAVAENGRRQAALDTEHRRALVRAMVIAALPRDHAAANRDAPPEALRRRARPEPVEVAARGTLSPRGARGNRRPRARHPAESPPGRRRRSAAGRRSESSSRRIVARAGARSPRQQRGGRTSGDESRGGDAGEARYGRLTTRRESLTNASIAALEAQARAAERTSRRLTPRPARRIARRPRSCSRARTGRVDAARGGGRPAGVDAYAFRRPGPGTRRESGPRRRRGRLRPARPHVDGSSRRLGLIARRPVGDPARDAHRRSRLRRRSRGGHRRRHPGSDIDLWFPTAAQAYAWGRRTVTIAVERLSPGSEAGFDS